MQFQEFKGSRCRGGWQGHEVAILAQGLKDSKLLLRQTWCQVSILASCVSQLFWFFDICVDWQLGSLQLTSKADVRRCEVWNATEWEKNARTNVLSQFSKSADSFGLDWWLYGFKCFNFGAWLWFGGDARCAHVAILARKLQKAIPQNPWVLYDRTCESFRKN